MGNVVVIRAAQVAHLPLSQLPFRPWPKHEARRLEIAARLLLYGHTHLDPDEYQVTVEERLNCTACRLHGLLGFPPSVPSWERIFVQASQPLHLRYVHRVMREGTEEYRNNLIRDVQTFGLVLTTW